MAEAGWVPLPPPLPVTSLPLSREVVIMTSTTKGRHLPNGPVQYQLRTQLEQRRASQLQRTAGEHGNACATTRRDPRRTPGRTKPDPPKRKPVSVERSGEKVA